ncbi:MAG: glutamate synthase subunit beta [Lachnospiraceae bacterium]|nr:glutamate synthase subunit beta [Lachnospiraceae bacterium]
MGKPTGFLEFDRVNNYDVPVAERIKNFEEFHKPLDDEARQEQAARCMNCGVPFCQSAMKLSGMVTGCPLHNLIPEWNDMIYRGNTAHAYSRLHQTSNFPEFTGRVCPALCEKACINGQYSNALSSSTTSPVSAVTIHDNELWLIEKAFAEGVVQPQIPEIRSGKKIAVIGAGPSGLATADTLNHRGHSVTVFEREDRIGGLLMYGIPNMKLDKSVIDRRQKLMEEEGVVFKTSVNVDEALVKELKETFDAVVLCCGAKKARPLVGEIHGKTKAADKKAADLSQVPGVYYAVDFLTSTTKHLLSGSDYISAKGKDVVVVGGGDTGNDCIGTVIRHGCKSVTALEMMPKPPVERAESNPWPQWPKVLKTDYGHEEAIEVFGHDPRVYETTVKSVATDEKGNLKEITTVQVTFKDGKLVLVEGSEKTIPCQILLIAAGFLGAEEYVTKAFGVKLDGRNRVATVTDPEGKNTKAEYMEDEYQTCVPGVFTAGDMHRGQSLVVWAIYEGRCCAKAVDEYLMGYSNL